MNESIDINLFENCAKKSICSTGISVNSDISIEVGILLFSFKNLSIASEIEFTNNC